MFRLCPTMWLGLAVFGLGIFDLVNGFIPRNTEYKTSKLSMSTVPLSTRIQNAVGSKYSTENVARVLDCWKRFIAGEKYEKYLDNAEKVFQSADCYVKGLDAMSFHEVDKFPWALQLEGIYTEIYSELQQYEKKHNNIIEKEWLGPRDQSGTAYGPEWKTLGLQDRSVWDIERSKDFPVTINYLKKFNVPSCEVFFAKQGPKSGIKPHSDKNNFIITCHVALDVPEGECWIQVGDTKHYWKNGKSCIFDTSILHSTENSSNRTRYVLLIRFWHPQLSAVEIDAFKFIFDYLDYAAQGDEALEKFEYIHLLMGKDKASPLINKPSKPQLSVDSKKLTNAKQNKGRGFG